MHRPEAQIHLCNCGPPRQSCGASGCNKVEWCWVGQARMWFRPHKQPMLPKQQTFQPPTCNPGKTDSIFRAHPLQIPRACHSPVSLRCSINSDCSRGGMNGAEVDWQCLLGHLTQRAVSDGKCVSIRPRCSYCKWKGTSRGPKVTNTNSNSPSLLPMPTAWLYKQKSTLAQETDLPPCVQQIEHLHLEYNECLPDSQPAWETETADPVRTKKRNRDKEGLVFKKQLLSVCFLTDAEAVLLLKEYLSIHSKVFVEGIINNDWVAGSLFLTRWQVPGLLRKERQDSVEIRMPLCAVTRRGQARGGIWVLRLWGR